MASRTNRERILNTLRLSARPLDDDELSRRASVSPRQAVNQICRALEAAGVLRRIPGPDGKIVNELRPEADVTAQTGTAPLHASDMGNAASKTPGRDTWAAAHRDEAGSQPGGGKAAVAETLNQPVMQRAAGHAAPAGSSSEQRAAERIMLDLLGHRLGLVLEPCTLTVPAGARVEVDGSDQARTVLVECWAHLGPPKSAQKHKVLADALKLMWISSTLYPRPRMILCLADPKAAGPFLPESRSWAAQSSARSRYRR